jgi:hypothetical protein
MNAKIIPFPTPIPVLPARLRWERERDTRYYEVFVERDLFGDLVLTRVWGRKGSALGGMKRLPLASLGEARSALAVVARRRAQHCYERVR